MLALGAYVTLLTFIGLLACVIVGWNNVSHIMQQRHLRRISGARYIRNMQRFNRMMR